MLAEVRKSKKVNNRREKKKQKVRMLTWRHESIGANTTCARHKRSGRRSGMKIKS